MDLGTAIILFFLVCGVGVAGLILLIIWFYRIGKRKPSAARVYHILAGLSGLVFCGIFATIAFLPRPLSNDPLKVIGAFPVAFSGNRVWMLAQVNGERGTSFGTFDRKTREFSWMKSYLDESDAKPVSMAWDGKQLAVTFEGDKDHLLVVRGDSIVFSEMTRSRCHVSYDAVQKEFLLAQFDDYREQFLIRHYDPQFTPLRTDTFHMDESMEQFTFGPNEIQYIGKNWYAADKKTYLLNFHGDTCTFRPFGTGTDSSFVLYGSLQWPRGLTQIITHSGIHSTGLPARKPRHVSSRGPGPYYELKNDSMLWRALVPYEGLNYTIDWQLVAGDFVFYETGSDWRSHYYNYELRHPKGAARFRVLTSYVANYNFKMVFPGKDTLAIEYYNFSKYAIFDAQNGARFDNVGPGDSVRELLNDELMVYFSLAVAALFGIWVAGMIYCVRKKSTHFGIMSMHLYSLIFFFLAALPYLVIFYFVVTD